MNRKTLTKMNRGRVLQFMGFPPDKRVVWDSTPVLYTFDPGLSTPDGAGPAAV
jgi:hypothetical protein